MNLIDELLVVRAWCVVVRNGSELQSDRMSGIEWDNNRRYVVLRNAAGVLMGV